jgi:hypothetical protein
MFAKQQSGSHIRFGIGEQSQPETSVRDFSTRLRSLAYALTLRDGIEEP